MIAKDNRLKDSDSSVAMMSSSQGNSTEKLRRQAEKILSETATKQKDELEALSFEEVRKMFHELQVHQIEVEIQNEELRRTHADLDIVLERYFDLYDLAPAGYCSLSEKGSILEFNLTAANMLGVVRGDLAKQPFSRFIFKEDQDIFYFQRKKLFETGEPQSSELRMIKGDGSFFWTTLTCTVIQDSDGVPVVRVVMVDITELKKSQEEKDKLQIQLKKAQRMRSIGRLAGGVAHDFNNMLNVILGYTEISLEQLSSSEPLYANLQNIRKAAERSADLTRQLLAFAGRQVSAPEILDLNSTVKEALKVMRRAIGENIELVWQPGAELWPINMDPVQIGQMLTSLCDNAGAAIVGRGTITMKTGNTTLDETYCAGHPWFTPGDYVQFALSDSGCGMDKEMMDKLFEPFFTTKKIFTGSGLGLATVYGVIKQNGGFIDVSSEPGQGTTFKIYLPRYVAVNEKVQNEDVARSTTSSRETILLVEDEPVLLELVAKLLRLKGYSVLATNNAHDALKLAGENVGNIRLLLTDVVMPDMNGDNLAQKLLADDPSLKCLFMSGYTADVITHRGLLNKGVNFIQKPFAINNLLAKIREVLETR